MPLPDFRFGWGRVNALRSVEMLEDNTYLSASINQGAQNSHAINIPAGTREARIMVYWADPPAIANSQTALINDLNMTVEDPMSTTYLPYLLDPTPNAAAVNSPAVPGVDSLNNMEQIVLTDPAAGIYSVDIDGYTNFSV